MDQQRVDQDKTDLKKDGGEIGSIKEKIKQDKASGNTDQLKKDKEALKEARHARKDEKKRLAGDRKEKRHDEKHP